MKLKTTVKFYFLAMVLMHLPPGVLIAGTDPSDPETQTITAFLYHAGPGDSRQMARALALWGAKSEAVRQSAGKLVDMGLLKTDADRKMEIFCLVADDAEFSVIEESFSAQDRVYTVRIEISLSLTDFVRAEIRNAALEEKELHFSWKEEMEPAVSPEIDPAYELSRVYRYIRQQHWRKAIIYLDHLEKKYPHWGDLFFAKGLGFEAMHETEQAIRSFSKACGCGNEAACKKKRNMVPSD